MLSRIFQRGGKNVIVGAFCNRFTANALEQSSNAGSLRRFSSGKRWFNWKSKQPRTPAPTPATPLQQELVKPPQEEVKNQAAPKPSPAKKNKKNKAPAKQTGAESSNPTPAAPSPQPAPEKSPAAAKISKQEAPKAKQTKPEKKPQKPEKKPQKPKKPEEDKTQQVSQKKKKPAKETKPEQEEGKAQAKKPKRKPSKKPKPAAEVAAESKCPVINEQPGESLGQNLVNTGERPEADGSLLTGDERLITGKAVVIVESPAKAKTIEKYLGGNYKVVASYGHIRDLAPRSGSVRPQEDFTLIWEIRDAARSHLNRIKSALRDAEAIVLASDPDREGEAIAWHVLEMLKQERALLPGLKIQRVTFNEITKPAVLAGMSSPRKLSQSLIDAYLARRALDYLIGFDISPILWRKLPGSKSAGRVQSAAVCLLSEREKEIESFTPREYWTVEAELEAQGSKFPARLTMFKGVKLEQFTLKADEALAAASLVSSSELQVQNLKSHLIRKNSPGPYITSSLQQDASSKLGFGASKTMLLAQRLYEGVTVPTEEEPVGLITYMRTDSQQLSQQAIESIRSLAEEKYGKEFVPPAARVFKTKVKNAQESHEAIRPTDIRRVPSILTDVLEPDALRLYALIWRRTMASQLTSALYNHIALDMVDTSGEIMLRSTASSINFLGFQIVFRDREALAAEEEESSETTLPALQPGSRISVQSAHQKQHFTEPPPRFTEGSLVKRLEELGIGRPSTYAYILKTLELRQYMKLEKQRIFTQLRGRMVAAFLSKYFPEFVDYNFTAKMEEQLDSISSGGFQWKEMLRQFWPSFHSKVSATAQVPIKQVADMLAGLFSAKLAGKDRKCPECLLGELQLKLTKFGAGYFLGCNRYPSCHYCNSLEENEEEDEETASPVMKTNLLLGVEPKSGLSVYYRGGPYGDYIQIGDDAKGKMKPRRVKLPQCLKVEEVDLEFALELMQYPKELGCDSEGRTVTLGIGKLGCYVRREGYSVFVPKELKVEEVTLETALEIIDKGMEERRKTRKTPISLKQRYALASQ